MCVAVVEFVSWLAGPVVLAAVPFTSSAHAWSYESVVSDGCHERITAEALRRVRAELQLPPIEATEDERLLIGELPFHVAGDMRDVAGTALLIGVRHNDLKGHGPRDVEELALVHGDPEAQDEHCLRRIDQDGSNGNVAALDECRSYIRDTALWAVERGVSTRDHLPDPGARTAVPVRLVFAGAVAPELPVAYVYLGHALHALQDSFTHAYRTKDGRAVTTVLNWVDLVEHEHDERRDGPAHSSSMDQCEGVDAYRAHRFELAIEASADLLRAALDPAVAPANRAQSIDGVLDEWLSHEPGCTLDNGWCDAPERRYDLVGCSVAYGAAGAGADRSDPVGFALAIAVLALLLVRERRAAVLCGTTLLSVWVMLAPGEAWAVPPEHPGGVRAAGAGGPRISTEADRAGDLAVIAAAGVAIDNGGFAVSLGGRWRFETDWSLGVDAELNPWFSIDTQQVEWGTFQSYVTLVRHYDVSPTVSLRTTAQVGVSTLLFDVYGVDSTRVGLYVALSLVGVQIDLDDDLAVVLDPAHVCMPVPQLTGAPFAYRQYRFTSALQWTI